MAVPTVFAPVLPQDFKLNPIQVHKRFVIQTSDLYNGGTPYTASGYKIWNAVFTNEKLKLDTNKTYPTNSWDGTYQHIIWKSIDSRFYRYPYDTCATVEHSNKRFTYKNLNYSASIFVIPQHDFGEGIKPGSVRLTNFDYNIMLQDDGNGNLYDINTSTSSIASKDNIALHLSFNSVFRDFDGFAIDPDLGVQSTNIGSGTWPFESSMISRAFARYRNCKFFDGPPVNSGLGARFVGSSSYIMVDHYDDLNFKEGDFTISFWLYNSLMSSHVILNKSEVLYKIEVDNAYSSSVLNESTPSYPYKFHYDFDLEQLEFHRSDGINTIVASMSYSPEGVWSHIGLVKTGSLVNFYKDGVLQCQMNDSTYRPYNRHNLLIGGPNLSSHFDTNDVIGISELRMYNSGLSLSQIQSLANTDTILQSMVVGNVFYKTGDIVVTTANPLWQQKYYLLYDHTSLWAVEFKSTHTIYEYECLVRIKKGMFNLSQNPSALKYPGSDLLISDFTGSLYPYITQIGLYNDKGELMAVGKLGQAIQGRSDVDLNIAMRWDV